MKKIRIIALLLCALMALTALSSCGECEHNYENGVCTACGATDPNYNEPCTHTFGSDGKCIYCGEMDPNYNEPCNNHSFVNGICTSCGYSCTHTFAEGACTICGAEDPDYVAPCTHSFENGECTKCGEACIHSFTDGICTVCNLEDPDWIPEDAGASMYKQIINDFKTLILYKYVNEELPPRSDDEEYYTDALYEVATEYDPTVDMGYAIKDINSDGFAELVLMGRDSRVYAMFTIVDRMPVVVAVFQKGMGYVTADGVVFHNVKGFDSSGGQISLGYHIKRLVGGELVGFEYGWVDADGSSSTDDSLYYQITEGGEKTDISYDDYKIIRDNHDYFWSYSTRLTRLVGFKFHSALIDTDDATVTADFSTYDAIINTFGLMHSVVAGGKYVRTDWTGGDYDTGMIFGSDEDYYIYNRLIGACVLVQNNSKATFGYALKDLNGDGIDELILLESKYYVLAVFTELDGQAILLDSFTDCRSAFIDAEGKIHVKQRIIPGHKKDAEYFVYEVGAGELVCTMAIGIKHTSNGTASEWYQISNGEKVSIEQSEYDTLYSEYLGDVGSDSYYEYTEANSGLEFVVTPTEE